MGNKLKFSKNIRYWIIPIAVVALLWSIAVTVFLNHVEAEKTKLRVETEVTGEQIKLRLESWVNHRLKIVENIASRWTCQNTIDKNKFTDKAEELLSWFPGLQALNWIDKDWTIQIVVPYKGNEPALGKNLNEHPYISVKEALTKAQKYHQISRSTIIELLQGGKGFATYWPVVTKNGQINGYINGVFKIDKLIESCFSEPLLTERFSIMFYEADKAVYGNNIGLTANQSDFLKTFSVKIVDKNLEMKIIPTLTYIKASHNYFAYWILGFTLLSSLLLGYFIRISMLHNQIVRKSEERFRTVVEHASDAFYLVTRAGEIIDVNKQACLELQYTKEELTSMRVEDIDVSYNNGALKIENNKSIFETKHKKKDGTIIPVEIHSDIIEINNELFILCLSRDISASKKLQELETRAQRLETAGQVAGQVAHDFNNLLAPLIAYPELIKEMLGDDHPAKELISKIEHSANQIAEINQQLLTLGRRGHYNQQIINLNNLIQQVVEDESSFCSNICRVETTFEQNLLPIKGGYSQIVRIISNLLHNSCDAIQENGVISIKTENYYLDNNMAEYTSVPKGEYIKLTVADNGHGIPQDILPTIFDPFISTKKADKKRGSGLGLSIVASVVKDHNGYVDVKSNVGEGTELFLYFPISREDIVEEKPIEIIGGNEKILVVDDDLMILEVTQKILEILGYQVKTAETGETALEMLQEESFDLLILDMIIPEAIDGTETFRRIIENNPTQAAIIVSGYAESERVNEAIRLGIKSFIKKPFSKETLSLAVREALPKESIILT